MNWFYRTLQYVLPEIDQSLQILTNSKNTVFPPPLKYKMDDDFP